LAEILIALGGYRRAPVPATSAAGDYGGRMERAGVRLPEHVAGEEIVLRRWRPSDAEALAQAVAESAEHLRPWMPWIAHEPLALAARRDLIARWGEEWAAGGDLYQGVFSQGRIAGGCGLHHRIGLGGLEIGYWIHPAFTRRGLATACARLLTDAGFTVPGIQHVEIHHDRANEASAGIPRKLGFTFVAEVPDEISAPAEVGIECVWRMDEVTWRRLHSSVEWSTARPGS
jgi:RimJ/RimL family protein N-acetyltransferase